MAFVANGELCCVRVNQQESLGVLAGFWHGDVYSFCDQRRIGSKNRGGDERQDSVQEVLDKL